MTTTKSVTHKPTLGGRESVKVAIAQVSPVFMDKDATIERACQTIIEAADNGAELIVFPEAWLAGYPFWSEGWDSHLPQWMEGRIKFYDNALLIPSEDTERLSEAVRRANAYVVMGCNELDPRPATRTIYNTLLFFNRDGSILGRHRKLMPTFTERMFWGKGDASDLVVFDTDIGRIGGLICGEHLMTLVRGAMIAQGEEIHVGVFPGSFALHIGPQLQEADTEGEFWGHFSLRAHAMEAGAFVLSACGYLAPDDVPSDSPYKNKMKISYANGGSSIITPLGVRLTGPSYSAEIVYAELQAMMLKVIGAIIDTVGHYARPDVVRLLVRRNERWQEAGVPAVSPPPFNREALKRAADQRGVDEAIVLHTAEELEEASSESGSQG